LELRVQRYGKVFIRTNFFAKKLNDFIKSQNWR
jgi:hypothetical protein